jgi:hypothetical protein
MNSPTRIIPFFDDDTTMPNEIVNHIVQTVPIFENEVFEYLENHPNALIQYLRENPHVVKRLYDRLSFDRQILGKDDAERAVRNEDSLQVDGLSDTVGRANSNSFGADLPPVNEWYPADPDDDNVDTGGDDNRNEELDHDEIESADAQPGPMDDNRNDKVDVLPPTDDGVAEPKMSVPTEPPNNPANEQPTLYDSDSNALYENEEPTKKQSRRVEVAKTLTQRNQVLKYPAPDWMVEASRKLPAKRGWRLFEEESCIEHMIDVLDEEEAGSDIKGEARFTEAARRMRDIDGIYRDKSTAVKNFWNRKGRARSGRDERRNPNDILATSRQDRKGAAPSTPKSKDDKKKETPKSKSNDMPHPTIRKRKKRDDSYDDDYEPAVDELPRTTKTPRMKKARHSATV